jgi:hypothetical protein
MSEVQVRPFRRADREQLTALVNAHIQAVVPGVAVSVNTVLSQLERNPGEFIVDPWVAERITLVAEQRGRVVAAAHLLRYGAGEDVGPAYRGSSEINWLLFWPRASHWRDSEEAAGALMDACLERLRSWGSAEHWHVDGVLPARLGKECAGFIEPRPTWPRAGAWPTSAAGPTSATFTWPRPTGAAGSPPGWSGRPRTGCGWPGWTACSPTPGRRSRTSWGS